MTLPLAPDAVRQFWEDGFLVIPEISNAQEINWLREVFDDLFARKVGWHTGDLFDFAGPETPGSDPVMPQLLDPSKYQPLLNRTVFRRNALALSRQLLGPTAELVYEHAVVKPAKVGGATPWHQDEAFFPLYTDYQSITIWMPLQPVDLSNGCMQFIAGSHTKPVLAHRRLNDDLRIHALEACGGDLSDFVSCPLPAGAATVHHCRTLHHAGPNLSDAPRRAYALGFGVRSPAFRLRTEFPWNAVRTSARDQRSDAAQGTLQRCINKLRKTAKAYLL